MTRRCSHCSHNDHNSRTCPNRGVKIFGVRFTDGSIRKSASMGNLTHFMGGGGGNCNGTPQNGPFVESPDHPSGAADGYGSEDFVAGSSSSRERKKGIPWTEDEHRMFLVGLQKVGKGDWRGISRNYVISRTPTQVASHAQKYFIRQSNYSKKKRRSSLFDIVPDESVDTPVVPQDFFLVNPLETEPQSSTPAPPPSVEIIQSENYNHQDATMIPNPECPQYPYPVIYPAYVTPFFPLCIPVWPGFNSDFIEEGAHRVMKPMAIHTKNPINVDELISMSKLNLGDSLADSGLPILSLKLLKGSTRPSAFHANPVLDESTMNSSHSSIPCTMHPAIRLCRSRQ